MVQFICVRSHSSLSFTQYFQNSYFFTTTTRVYFLFLHASRVEYSRGIRSIKIEDNYSAWTVLAAESNN